MPGAANPLGVGLLALHLVFQALLFSAVSMEAFEFPKTLAARLTALLLLGLACGSLLRRDGAGRAWPTAEVRALARDPLVLAVLGVVLAATLATATSISPRRSLYGSADTSAGLLTIASGAVVFLGFRALAAELKVIRLWLWAVLTAQGGLVAYAALQLAGLDPIPWRGASSFGTFVRVGSTLGNPNFLGGWIAAVTPLGLWLVLDRWRASQRGAALLAACVVMLGVGVLAATLSRAALAALGIGGVALLVGWWWVGERAAARALALVAAGLLAVGACYAVAGGLGQRAIQRFAATAERREPRLDPWLAAISMFRSRPATGVGVDSFQLAYPLHQPLGSRHPMLEEIPARAHNAPLHTAATQGAAGLLALGALGLATLLSLRRALARSADPAQRGLVVALGASLAACATRSMVAFTVAALGSVLALQLGVLARLAWGAPLSASCGPDPAHARGEAHRGRALLLAGAALAAVAAGANAAAASPAAAPHVAFGGLAVLLGAGAVALLAPPWPAAGDGRRRHRGTLAIALAVGAAAWALVVLPFRADSRCRLGRDVARDVSAAHSLPILREAVALDGANDGCWHQLGASLHRAAAREASRPAQREHLAAARRAYRRASDLVPANALHHANVARVLADSARVFPEDVDPAAVFAAFEAAIALTPASPRFLDDAGRAALLLGNPAAAAGYAERALARLPGHAPALALRGIAALERGRPHEAVSDLLAASGGSWRGDVTGRAASFAQLALAQQAVGAAAAALEAAEEAVRLDPRSASAQRIRAEILGRQVP